MGDEPTSRAPRASLTSLAKKLALVLVSVTFTLALLEIGVRILHLGSGGFWEPHPLYGWRNIPNASGWESCYGECAVHVKMNSHGLRDVEVAYDRTPGVKRVLFLGDSMTAGLQVPLEDTFAKVMEADLNAVSGPGAWQSVNAAVNGYGTDNELLLYQLEAHKYQSDYVVLGVYLANDVYNNSRDLDQTFGGNSHKPYFVLNEDGSLELMNFPVEDADSLTVKIGSFLKKNFQLPRFVAEALRLRAQVPGFLEPLVRLFSGERGVQAQEDTPADTEVRPTGDICDEAYIPEVAQAWDITKALIRELRSEVEASSARFVVLVIPASAQIVPPAEGKAYYCERPNQELDGFLQAEGIPYLDLLDAFRQHALESSDPLYYTRDFHMNENGHRLAGDVLAGFMRDLDAAQP